MSLLNNTGNQKTNLEIELDLIYQLTGSTYYHLVGIQKQGIQRVWSNPAGFTPQEIFDALGTNSVKLIEFHAALSELIIHLAIRDGITPDISLPTNAFVKNPDGTVTVLNSPYEI